jgi:chromosome partitioning protein
MATKSPDHKHWIYLIGCEKGGAGKTTISFNLAVMRARAGYPVLLVDADKQASSAMWASMRTEAGHMPSLVCVQKLGKIGHDLIQLKENYEVIVDAGGVDSQELRQGIAVADFWILPVRPGQLDLFSMAKMAQLMTDVEERVGRAPKTAVVLNAINSSTNEAADARELLSENPKMPVMQTQLADRVAMRRAVLSGCSVLELTGTNKTEAVAEMLSLYQEVFGEKFRDATK